MNTQIKRIDTSLDFSTFFFNPHISIERTGHYYAHDFFHKELSLQKIQHLTYNLDDNITAVAAFLLQLDKVTPNVVTSTPPRLTSCHLQHVDEGLQRCC